MRGTPTPELYKMAFEGMVLDDVDPGGSSDYPILTALSNNLRGPDHQEANEYETNG